jgi:NADH-quinone oxidoreductase subunit N
MTLPVSIAQLDLSLMAPELWLTLLSCVVLGIDFIWPRFPKHGLTLISIGGMSLIILELIGYWATGKSGSLFGGMFVLDPFAIFFKVFILVSTIFVALASMDYLKRIPFFRGEYDYLLLFSALGMMFMVSANDFLSFFITLEFSTFGFYILVTYLRDDLKSNEAGIKYFILGVLTAALTIYGISLVYGATGTILFSELANVKPALSVGLIVGLLFIFVGLGYKLGAAPFHAWVPDVYEGAPTPVTMFLSIAPKGAALALFLRVAFDTFRDLRGDWSWFIASIAILSMTYGNVVAIAQKNMKRLLAYSGIAQVGNILIGMAAGSKMGGDSMLFYILTYLFANVGAFVVVIAYSNLTQRDDIDDLAGLARRSPTLGFAMLIFLLSLAGVPPLAGFIAKIYIFAAAINQHLIFLVVIGLINIIISMYYYLIVVKKVYTIEPSDPSPIPMSLPIRLVLYACMAGVILLGIYPRPLIDLSVAATGIFSHIPIR